MRPALLDGVGESQENVNDKAAAGHRQCGVRTHFVLCVASYASASLRAEAAGDRTDELEIADIHAAKERIAALIRERVEAERPVDPEVVKEPGALDDERIVPAAEARLEFLLEDRPAFDLDYVIAAPRAKLRVTNHLDGAQHNFVVPGAHADR